MFPTLLLQEVRQALEDMGVQVGLLKEIQLCRSQTWKDQVSLRAARAEPDHQTMFLHFSTQQAKEHGKGLLGGQWVRGISKGDNHKRDSAKSGQILTCFYLKV